MDEVASLIAKELHLPLDNVKKAILYAPTRVRRYKIKKNSGGTRTIIQPAASLKPILYWLEATVFSKLPVHKCATAFVKGRSILDNASIHGDAKYSLRIDIKSFFPSLRPHDLEQVLKINSKILPNWVCTNEGVEIISRVCFDNEHRLPIGYPTSPSIANAVMFELDGLIEGLLTQVAEVGKAAVTRYADDFVFSTDKTGACNFFLDQVVALLDVSKSPKLEINPLKTRFMSRGGGSTLVTGLRINNQGNVVVHANYRDHVRLLLKLYKSGVLAVQDVPKLVGHLAYIQHVDPALFSKLSMRYFNEIEVLRTSKAVA